MQAQHRPDSYCINSFLIKDWLPSDLADTIYARLIDGVPFEEMHNFGSAVPRLICVQGAVAANGTIPLYRHPTDSPPVLQPWSEVVAMLVDRLNALLQSRLNHVLIQLYRNGKDNISEHSDKTLDIVPDSPIVNVSFGAKRVLTLRGKQDVGPSRERIDIPLPHNSVFCLDLATNAAYKHALRQNNKLVEDMDSEELAYGTARISLTFRQIGTFLTRDGRIFGMGAIKKVEDEAQPISEGKELQTEVAALYKAFSRENKEFELNWTRYYGTGYNCCGPITRAS